MASGNKRASEWELSAEGMELSKDVMSTLAHELGGIASAIDLRAVAMGRSISEQDRAALQEIAEEVRMATRAARFARGPDGNGMLNPMRRQSLAEWWRLAGRFTGSVLPRGVAVEPRFGDVTLTAERASALTWIWLAGCKEVGERGIKTPATIILTGHAAGDGDSSPCLIASIDASCVDVERAPSRWSRYAGKAAKALGVDAPAWQEDEGVLRWRVVLPE